MNVLSFISSQDGMEMFFDLQKYSVFKTRVYGVKTP